MKCAILIVNKAKLIKYKNEICFIYYFNIIYVIFNGNLTDFFFFFPGKIHNSYHPESSLANYSYLLIFFDKPAWKQLCRMVFLTEYIMRTTKPKIILLLKIIFENNNNNIIINAEDEKNDWNAFLRISCY